MATLKKDGPLLMGYQLVGGTISVMVWHAIARKNSVMHRLPMKTVNCHSYWNIEDIASHLDFVSPSLISDRVILSVGYQDARNQGLDIDVFKCNFELIVNTLRFKGCRQMIVTNVPPCAAASRTLIHWKVLQKMNDLIWGFCCENDDLIFCNIFQLFCYVKDGKLNRRYITKNVINYKVDIELYNMWCSHNSTKKDLITFSNLGKKKLLEYLEGIVIGQIENAVRSNLETIKEGTSNRRLAKHSIDKKTIKEGTSNRRLAKHSIDKKVVEVDLGMQEETSIPGLEKHDKALQECPPPQETPIVIGDPESKKIDLSHDNALQECPPAQETPIVIDDPKSKVMSVSESKSPSSFTNEISPSIIDLLKKWIDQKGALFNVAPLPSKVPRLDQSIFSHDVTKKADLLQSRDPRLKFRSLCSRSKLNRVVDLKPLSYSKKSHRRDKASKTDRTSPLNEFDLKTDKVQNIVKGLKDSFYKMKKITPNDVPEIILTSTDTNHDFETSVQQITPNDVPKISTSTDTIHNIETSVQRKIDEFSNPDLKTKLSTFKPNSIASELAKLCSTTFADLTLSDDDTVGQKRDKPKLRKSLKRLLDPKQKVPYEKSGEKSGKCQKHKRRKIYKEPTFLAHDFYCGCNVCHIGHHQLLNKTKKLIKLLQEEDKINTRNYYNN